MLTFGLLATLRLALAQADVSVSTTVENPRPAANELVYAVIDITNEGSDTRRDLQVSLRMSPALFFVSAVTTDNFDDARLEWQVAELPAGQTKQLRIAVQPNYGGVHTLTAELTNADGIDWDSSPGNDRPYEDDQDQACLSVPVAVDCGQELVLRAPSQQNEYSWYRDGELLAYATSDTLHPSSSGEYTFLINGQGCAAGNCCPVIVARAACAADLALTVGTTPLGDDASDQEVEIKLYNQGAGPVTKASLYVTTSRFMRLKPGTINWQLAGNIMKTDWTGMLYPGEVTTVNFSIESIPGGSATDYQMFAEVAAFYAGSTLLTDDDSTPDYDPTNDALIDDAYTLAREEDEDDSDITSLSNCPAITVAGNQPTCPGESLTLTASESTTPVSYSWSGQVEFSCTTCRSTTFQIAADTEVKLTTTTSDGCSTEQTLNIEAKQCLDAMLLVVSPYAPLRECLDAPNQQASLCAPNWPASVSAEVDNTSEANLPCLLFSTLGEWSGSIETCVELCTNTPECSEVELTLIALPKLDSFVASTDAPLCIAAGLQVDAAPVAVDLPEPINGVSLVDAGSDCYELRTPTGSFADVQLQLVHTYRVAGQLIYDTTLVNVAGQTVCELAVFAEDTVRYSAGGDHEVMAADETLCVLGTSNQLADLNFTLNGDPLPNPTSGCNPYTAAEYSLQALPTNFSDNGWRITRFYLNQQLVINNFYAPNMAAVLAKLESVEPGLSASYDEAAQRIELAGYTRLPAVLQLAHLPTGQRVSERPSFRDKYLGASLALPDNLGVGSYELLASDGAGCMDVVQLLVTPPMQLDVQRDTLHFEVEVGEPLAVCGLQGLSTSAQAWSALTADCRVYTAPDAVTSATFTFSKTTATTLTERIIIVDVIDYSCTPLMVDARLRKLSTKCRPEYFNLGLTRPDLQVSSSSGTVLSTTEVSGSRAGAAYPVATLPHGGLADNYRVSSWTGMGMAVGKTGNLMEIIRTLRRGGADVYMDWDAGEIKAGGSGLDALRLVSTTTMAVYTLTPARRELATYGRFLGRTGINSIIVSGHTCSAPMRAQVDCQVIVWGSGSIFEFTAGGMGSLSIDQLDLPLAFATWSIEEVPSDLIVSKAEDGQALVFTAAQPGVREVVVSACDSSGNCRKVRVEVTVTAALADIWRPEGARLQANPYTGKATFALPAAFNEKTDVLAINGKVQRGNFQRKKVVVEQVYPSKLEQQVVLLGTPFGKTARIAGDLAPAVQEIFTDPGTTVAGGRVSIKTDYGSSQLYVRDEFDIWGPLKPMAVVAEERNVLELAPGSYELTLRTAAGIDTLAVVVDATELHVHNETVRMEPGIEQEYCLPASLTGKTPIGVTNACASSSGERAAVVQHGDCFTITAYETGEETVCIVRKYLDGSIDSINLSLQIRVEAALATAPDRDTVEIGQFKLLEVLANDQLTDEPRSVSLISEPFFGRAQVVGNTAISYLHNGGDCAVDVFTYEVCQGERCDSATVQIDVYCEDLLIYNGFSPNGDGVNDELTILGLGRYPDHVLSIFNRDGQQLVSFRDYSNDWRGKVSGRELAAGTYFYVIELGDGHTQSGYIQLSR